MKNEGRMIAALEEIAVQLSAINSKLSVLAAYAEVVSPIPKAVISEKADKIIADRAAELAQELRDDFFKGMGRSDG